MRPISILREAIVSKCVFSIFGTQKNRDYLQATEKWVAKVEFPILITMPEAYTAKFGKLKAQPKQLFQMVQTIPKFG